MPEDASALKQRGNDLFKARRMAEAALHYKRAEEADPTDPVYPSNLSAALYETGDYASCLAAIHRAWELLKDDPGARPEIVLKLSTRLTKALCHGVCASKIPREVILHYHTAVTNLHSSAESLINSGRAMQSDENRTHMWDDWVRMQSELIRYTERREACLWGLSRLPMLCKPLAPEELYFSIGHDRIVDLTAGWLKVPDPLKIDSLPREKLSDLSFMFGGVGDGRHALGTLTGLHLAYKKLSKEKRQDFFAHLTLLDIDHSILARDLCMLMLLYQLSRTRNADTRIEIKATLMYTFLGVVMPSYCHSRLQSTIKDLRRRLLSSPPDLPSWLYVTPASTPAIVRTLDHWLVLKRSTRLTLEHHNHRSKLIPPNMSRMSEDQRRAYRAYSARKREESRAYLYSASGAELVEAGLIPSTVPAAGRRRYLEDNIELILDERQKLYPFGKVRPLEDLWYTEFKILVPPDELEDRHPELAFAWSLMAWVKCIDPALRRQVADHINKDWKPNVTLFAPKYSDPKRFQKYPRLDIDVLDTVGYIDHFNGRTRPDANRPARQSEWIIAYEACDDFFEEAAAALKGLSNRITLEILCGSLSEELSRMSAKADVDRPEEFPRRYTRMWLSNVPDYVHGPMNTIVYNLPNLQEDSHAALAFNCRANFVAFINDDEYFHTYTLLSIQELPRYMACEVVKGTITESFVLRSLPLPQPLMELASQAELKTWLTRVLFNTFLPTHSKLPPSKVHVPHNLVAFFGLLVYLHRVGYPSHWIADFLAGVLSGSVVSDIEPYLGEYPIPLTERARRVQPRRVRTDPWLVELETIIATAYYALPFSLAGALPDDFSREPADMVVWEAQVRPAPAFFMEAMFNPAALSVYDMRTHLAFYRSDLVNARDVTGNLSAIFEGKTTPAPGTFFILTAQEYVHHETSIRFRLSRRRMERMRTQSWSMVAYRKDTGHQTTLPVAIEYWALFRHHDDFD